MPELPEVETIRRRLDRAFRGKRLSDVVCDPADRLGFDRQTPEQFRQALIGARIRGTGRRGKYLWLELDRRPWPVLHFGMTGNVLIRSKKGRARSGWGGLSLQSGSPREEGGVVWFSRLKLVADDGTEAIVTDPRRFGRFRLAEDPISEPPISKLGFDPLGKFPQARELGTILGRRKAPIKAVLLDQKLFAGVGNWIADEALFQAGLSPHRLASRLGSEEIRLLRSKLLTIIRRAVKVGADYERFPRSWLFHSRWGKGKEAMTLRGERIRFDEVGGRTTAWVPGRQV